MAALIVPFSLVRNAVHQSARLGMDEPQQAVVDRVLQDLRNIDHPAARQLRSLSDYQGCGSAPAPDARA